MAWDFQATHAFITSIKNNVRVYDDNISLKNKKIGNLFLTKEKLLNQNLISLANKPRNRYSKKCKLSSYIINNRKKIITELDIFYLSCPDNKKITITGTNGKSTTCQMLYNIFKSKKYDVRLVGNIGKSPLEEKKLENKLFLLLRLLLTKYHIVNILKQTMLLF